MTDKNIEAKNDKQDGINPVMAAVTGAVVGAGVTVAGIVAFKDKKNRDFVKRTLINLRDQELNHLKDLKSITAQEATKNGVTKITHKIAKKSSGRVAAA